MFFEQRGGQLDRLTGTPAGVYSWQWEGRCLLGGQLPGAHQGPPVTGLIFHMSRCGSTLLARLLAEDPSTLVLNEPDVVNMLLKESLSANDCGSTDSVDAALAQAIARIGSQVDSDAHRIVIKTTSWNAAKASTLMRAFPDARCVFLERDPRAVLASLDRNPPGWAIASNAWLLGDDRDPTSPSSFASALSPVTQGVRSAVATESTRWRSASYVDLPGAAESVAEWFGVATRPVVDSLGSVSAVHSKTGAAWRPDQDAPADASVGVEEIRPIEWAMNEVESLIARAIGDSR